MRPFTFTFPYLRLYYTCVQIARSIWTHIICILILLYGENKWFVFNKWRLPQFENLLKSILFYATAYNPISLHKCYYNLFGSDWTTTIEQTPRELNGLMMMIKTMTMKDAVVKVNVYIASTALLARIPSSLMKRNHDFRSYLKMKKETWKISNPWRKSHRRFHLIHSIEMTFEPWSTPLPHSPPLHLLIKLLLTANITY